MHSRIPENTKKDTRYCAKMWVINRVKVTGKMIHSKIKRLQAAKKETMQKKLKLLLIKFFGKKEF